MTDKIAILAGGGGVPLEVSQALKSAGRPYHVIALKGFAETAVAGHPHTWVGLGQLGAMLAVMQREGCQRLIIIGSLARPDLMKLRFDLGAVRHARAIYGLTRGGDDSLLRRVVRFFEMQGLEVIGVGEAAPELLACAGRIAGPDLTATQRQALQYGWRALDALAEFDIGQAVVARPQGIIAVEDAGGTRRMLARLGRAAPGCADRVLVKLPKRAQELRVDMPTIGAATIEEARSAGIGAIVVAAGATVVADRHGLLRAANDAGIAVAAIDPGIDDTRRAAAKAGATASSDGQLCADVVTEIARWLHPDTSDVGALVRFGHVGVVEIDGLAKQTWPMRLKAARRNAWGLPSLPWRRRSGAMHVVLLRGRGCQVSAIVGAQPASELADALRRGQLASIGLHIAGCNLESGDAASVNTAATDLARVAVDELASLPLPSTLEAWLADLKTRCNACRIDCRLGSVSMDINEVDR